MKKVVVIGAGQAGFAVAARLRAKKFDGRITLIGEESDAPYQRPPLSKKYLTGEMARERLYFRPADFYAEQDIDFRPDSRVASIDRATKTIRLGDERLPYDVLVLTTGAKPRRLPADAGGDLEGLYYLRTLADIDAMRPEFRKGARLLIIGGGYIGLETAAVATLLGVETTLIEAANSILQRVAAPETAAFFRKLHTERGVTLIEGAGLKQLAGTTRVNGAILSDGRRIETDFVIAGIGVIPATELAEAAGLALDNGIKVDELGRTSDPDIYAVGDCSSFPHGDARLRLESVPNAIDQGNAAADAILGATASYVAKPWFWSDQFDVKLQIAGLNSGYDRTVSRPGKNAGAMSVWYFRNGRLLAVDAANDPAAYMTGKRWIESGLSPSPEDIADSTRTLKELPVR